MKTTEKNKKKDVQKYYLENKSKNSTKQLNKEYVYFN